MAEEKHYRSLVKAISWRVTGTCDTILIAWLITGQVKAALGIGFVDAVHQNLPLLRPRTDLEPPRIRACESQGRFRHLAPRLRV